VQDPGSLNLYNKVEQIASRQYFARLIEPMLPQVEFRLSKGTDWFCELKLDGHIAYACKAGTVAARNLINAVSESSPGRGGFLYR